MANKDFGVKKIELIGSSGTPNLTSPTNLNLNANTVAISTDITIGGKVQSDVIVGSGYSVGIGSTQPQQALDISGTIRATAFVKSDGSSIGSGGGGGVTGITIKEEASVVGSADSVTSIDFVSSNLTAAASGTDATITLSDTPSFTSAVVGSAVNINSTGVNVVGTVTATSFSGDGSQLSNIGAGTTSEWTLGANGNSHYTFTGPGLIGAENDPTLYLVRGQSYRFTNNMGAHPFSIQNTPNGSAGSQYNDGITNNNVSNGTLVWDVQFDAPNVLYYQCTAHNNMGGPIYIVGDSPNRELANLTVTGVTTINQGRIQADASSNIRFGNLAAGSGSGRNIAIGDQVLGSLASGNGRNIGLGEFALNNVNSGGYNIGIGVKAGQLITNGQYNVVIGGYDGNTSNLDIRTLSNRVIIADGEGNIRQYITNDGKVGINTTVVPEVLTVSGVVSATSLYGSLPSNQLTGALPALDGSALTGVSAVGSGIEVRNSGSAIGAAATIDFGSRLSVSPVSAGVVTITGDAADIPGINTTGTSVFDVLDIGGAVTIDGLTKIGTAVTFNATSGIVSATEFYGDGSNLRNVPASSVYVDESEDDNQDYNVVFLDGAGGADTNHVMQVDSTAFKYNPSTGKVTAASFAGAASDLTNIPAGQLIGTLPSIDGSALLNVNATGDGVVVENSGSNVGSAKTINFDTGLDVTYSAGIATVTSSGGSLKNRTTVSTSTASIADNAVGLVTVTGFKSYALMKVGLSTAGWIRIYTDNASRTADSSRSVGEDPTAGSGVIAEVVTTGISTEQKISPFTMGGNMDDPVDTTIYMAITNLSGTTQTIDANLTILQLEA